MKCPRCRLINPDTAQRCDCGYDFETKTVQESYLPRDPKLVGVGGWLALLILMCFGIYVGVRLWENQA